MITQTKKTQDISVIGIDGRVGEAESRDLEQAFLDVFDQGCYKLVVDLEKVDFITSSGLGVLMMAMKQTRENDGFVRIACPQPLIEQILRTTRLDTFFDIYQTLEEAI